MRTGLLIKMKKKYCFPETKNSAHTFNGPGYAYQHKKIPTLTSLNNST